MADSEGKTAFDKLTPDQQRMINEHVTEFLGKYGKYMDDAGAKNRKNENGLKNYVAESAIKYEGGADKFLESVEVDQPKTTSIPHRPKPNTITV
ncbi:MAG: hypothetical protein ABL867_02980 [Rickettsiales bacterium]